MRKTGTQIKMFLESCNVFDYFCDATMTYKQLTFHELCAHTNCADVIDQAFVWGEYPSVRWSTLSTEIDKIKLGDKNIREITEDKIIIKQFKSNIGNYITYDCYLRYVAAKVAGNGRVSKYIRFPEKMYCYLFGNENSIKAFLKYVDGHSLIDEIQSSQPVEPRIIKEAKSWIQRR